MTNTVLSSEITSDWDEALQELRASFGESVFKNWLCSVVIGGFESGVLKLFLPTRFIRDWVQKHYSSAIFASMQKRNPDVTSLLFEINAGCDSARHNTLSSSLPVALDSSPAVAYSSSSTSFTSSSAITSSSLPSSSYVVSPVYEEMSASLDSRFTFANFVVGTSNEFAFLAAKKIALGEGAGFSPLFLNSAVGLGKTHLLQAIANDMKQNHPDKKVLYLSAERFMYKFIDAVKTNTTTQFKEIFRSVDVLLVDDIQFMAGKDATQQEFLHTFNELSNSGKQIVLSADKPAEELKGLDIKLTNRFAAGLAITINPADYDLRIGILRKKSLIGGLTLSDEVLDLIANNCTQNIRELEGALHRLIAQTDLLGIPLNLLSVGSVLRTSSASKTISVDDIQKTVANFYGIKLADLRSERKQKEIALPRQIAMYLAKECTTRSLLDIARSFDREHATIIYAVKKVQKLLASDSDIQRNISVLKSQISA